MSTFPEYLPPPLRFSTITYHNVLWWWWPFHTLAYGLRRYKQRPNAKIAPIAREFHITARRLWYRLKNGSNLPGVGEANRLLSSHQELAVCTWLHRLIQLRIDTKVPLLKNYANSILQLSYTDSTTPPPTVGNSWSHRFFQRHPEFKPRKKRKLSKDRKLSHDPPCPHTPESNTLLLRKLPLYTTLVNEKEIIAFKEHISILVEVMIEEPVIKGVI